MANPVNCLFPLWRYTFHIHQVAKVGQTGSKKQGYINPDDRIGALAFLPGLALLVAQLLNMECFVHLSTFPRTSQVITRVVLVGNPLNQLPFLC